MLKIIMLLALLCLNAAATAAEADKLPDAMRGKTPIAESTKPPLLGNEENKDIRRTRAYDMQPPTIPHKIDNYQIDRNYNQCMSCHARSRTEETQAIPISITHYLDRKGKSLAQVSPRRYFCTQCHVPQADRRELVPNTFQDIDTVLKNARASGAAKKK
ncbi:MAG: nitrate reductase cytochrome c-type subunit [Rhodocyclaceae bacterium]